MIATPASTVTSYRADVIGVSVDIEIAIAWASRP
jgi:hypothetical protein